MKGASLVYDTIIIGAGPAGLFAALELSKNDPNHKILIIDKGNDLDERLKRENKLDSIHGAGGSGAFSDGKLVLNPEIGGNLAEFIGYSKAKELIDEVDKQYVEFGAPEKTYEVNKQKFTKIKRAAAAHSLKLIQDVIRHMGTDGNIKVVRNIRNTLQTRGVEFEFNTTVRKITKTIQAGGSIGYLFQVFIKKDDEGIRQCKHLIVAPGRSGSEWFSKVADTLRIEKSQELPIVDIGTRIEVPSYILDHLTKEMYEPKLIYYSKEYDVKVRTFCCCLGGQVSLEVHNDFYSVNGHSNSKDRTDLTNFAILVSEKFGFPFHQPGEYGAALAKLSNMLCDKVIVQRFVDLERGRRSTPERMKRLSFKPTLKECQPGDLSLVIPHRQMTAIKEMMHALNGIAPGLAEEAILYGLEVKLYSHKYELTENMESSLPRLFITGDGSGASRSLMQASCTGVLAARKILN